MAGSRRVNIHGHITTGQPEELRRLSRLPIALLEQLYQQAGEQGQARVSLDDQPYTLRRHSDHTFVLEPGNAGRMML